MRNRWSKSDHCLASILKVKHYPLRYCTGTQERRAFKEVQIFYCPSHLQIYDGCFYGIQQDNVQSWQDGPKTINSNH